MSTDCVRKAMDYLARREHSRQEIARKLLAKGFDVEIIDLALEQLKSQGLQCDLRFAESYVRHRVAAGFGPVRIMTELVQRGVSDDVAGQMLYRKAIDWQACLKAACQKKYPSAAPFGSPAYAAQCRFLSQRGFEMDAICQLLNGQANENE